MAEERIISLNLTTEQHRKLIELAYLGEWFINAHHEAEYQDEAATEALQKILGAHALAGLSRDVETSNYYLDSEWTDRLYDQYIADYDDHVFWDELTERLAQRDLARKRGVSMDEIEREDDLLELRPLEDHYRRELEHDGVERLDFTDRF
jgi:hypothetical protein